MRTIIGIQSVGENFLEIIGKVRKYVMENNIQNYIIVDCDDDMRIKMMLRADYRHIAITTSDDNQEIKSIISNIEGNYILRLHGICGHNASERVAECVPTAVLVLL